MSFSGAREWLHTNPVSVLIAGRPIRASRESAQWCWEAVELLWEKQHQRISEAERPQARKAYDEAIERYRRIAEEAQ